MKKTKKIILSAIIIAVVIGICGYFAKISYEKKQEEIRLEKIETKNSEILAEYQRFEKEEDREKRLSCYNEFEIKMNQYYNEEESFEGCKKNYEEYYKKMKDNLVGYYSEKIEEYSSSISSDLEKVKEKKSLNKLIESFTSLKEQIASENEKYNLLDNESFNGYNEKIDSLIDSYQKRVKAIKKAEKEAEEAAKKKAEEEAAKKAAEEEKKKQQSIQNNNNNNKNNNSNKNNNNKKNNSNSSNDKNNGKNNYSGNYRESWTIDANGKKHHSIRYENGDVYEDGKYVGNTAGYGDIG